MPQQTPAAAMTTDAAPGAGRAIRRLHLEDLAVGQVFTSAAQRIEAAEMVEFASRFDPQPFHVDEEAARDSLFGGLAASGWHTAAVSMRLLVESLPIAGGMIGAGGEISWPAPTRPGDILRVESELLEIRPSRSRPDRGTIIVRNETRNQREVVVQVFVAKILVMRRPAAGS